MRLGGGLRRMDMYRTGPKSTGTVPTLPCSLVGQIEAMAHARSVQLSRARCVLGRRSVFDTNRGFRED